MTIKHTLLFSVLILPTLLSAQSKPNKLDDGIPFGWATCTTIEDKGSYPLIGGNEGKSITLFATQEDMRESILQAVQDYDIIVFDGSKGDFIISSTMKFSNIKNKTFIGKNHARLCSKFVLTKEIHELLNQAKVRSITSVANGQTYTLPNGKVIKEQREYAIRKLLIEHANDQQENYQHSGIIGMQGCENLIFRNLIFQGPGSIDVGGDDLLSAKNTKHIWVDHCEFIDGIDGNFDITNQSDFLTISWSVFRYTERSYIHANTNLIGSNDNAVEQGEDMLNVTFAQCIWDKGCDQRMPMVRFGTVHVLNCAYFCRGNAAAVNARKEAEVLLENCYFAQGVKNIFKENNAKSYNFIGNVYVEPFKQPLDKGLVSIPYKYKAFSTSKVPLTLRKYAGATL